MASSALLKAAAFAALLIGSAAAPCSGEHCVSDEVSLLQASAQVTKAAERQETEVQKENTKETGDMNEQELKAFRTSLGVTDDDFGSSDCPCIGINHVEGVIFGKVDQGDDMPDGVSFPADLGARCDEWDADSTDSLCTGHLKQGWCFQKWCYVDPCNCKGTAELPKPSAYLRDAEYKGHAIYYSYATCGAKDTYSKSDSQDARQKRIDESCSKKGDEVLWGKADCQCTGFSPLEGVKQVLNGKTVLEYVADYGSDCKAWDLDNDPACMEDDAPEYCVEKWCYVDASCQEAGVQTSTLMPDATVDGKPVTYSYATCGGVDKYTNN